jgi:hypothetical protein
LDLLGCPPDGALLTAAITGCLFGIATGETVGMSVGVTAGAEEGASDGRGMNPRKVGLKVVLLNGENGVGTSVGTTTSDANVVGESVGPYSRGQQPSQTPVVPGQQRPSRPSFRQFSWTRHDSDGGTGVGGGLVGGDEETLCPFGVSLGNAVLAPTF